MVTKEQAMNASYREEFHYGECTETIGARGAKRRTTVTVRVCGLCKTWKTRPDEFALPVRYGIQKRTHGITHENAHEFHRAVDCPLNSQ